MLLLILILGGVSIGVHAQKGFAIQAVFDEYAVGKNVTEVMMGAGRLKKYNLSLFHSLEINRPSQYCKKNMAGTNSTNFLNAKGCTATSSSDRPASLLYLYI